MNFTSTNVSVNDYSRNWRWTLDDILTAESVLLIVLSLCILFGNGLVCVAFARERKLQTTTNRFVVSLACSDILVGVVIIPLYMYIKSARFILDNLIYESWMALEITACSSSVATLVAVSIERCISVTMPAFHRNISRRTVYVTIAIVWCHSVFLSGSLIYFFSGKDRQPWMALYRTIASFFLPLLIILIAYWYILKVAVTRDRRRNARLARDLRLAATVALLIGAFVASWFPFNTLSIVAAYHPKAPVDWGLALVLVKWLQYLNSIINPIIYSYCNKDFRCTFIKLLRLSKNQNRNRTFVYCDPHRNNAASRAGNQNRRSPGNEFGRIRNEGAVMVSAV